MSETDETMPQKQVLVVDDDTEMLRLIQVILQNSGYKVLLANDPLSGLDIASKQNPDLIILDVAMPIIKGWDVLEQLRHNEATKKIPVIIITADDSIETINKAFSFETTAYVSKPFASVKLIDKVNELLEKK
ncbi:PleD family two-component system response regulator [Elusimicrobiota bacterium]